MPSDEALRAAAVICRNKIWKAADRVIEVAEIIDREFQSLRAERDELRKALDGWERNEP